jgi:hypothetical protein
MYSWGQDSYFLSKERKQEAASKVTIPNTFAI